MPIIGIGTDIIEIERIKKSIKASFLKKVFTENENKMFESNNMKAEMIAANFAAKEALLKAFGTGFNGIRADEIEVLRDERGKPEIEVFGAAKAMAGKLGVNKIFVTLSHSKEFAVGFVILEKGE